MVGVEKRFWRARLHEKLFDSALIIAIVTGFAYVSTLSYEGSYLHYFGVDQDTVKVQLEPTLSVALAMLLIIGLVSYIFMRLGRYEERLRTEATRASRIKMVLLGFSVLFLVVAVALAPILYLVDPAHFWVRLRDYICIIVALPSLIALTFLLIVYVFRKKRPVGVLVRRLSKNVRPTSIKPVLFIALFTICLTSPIALGINSARERHQYKEVDIEGQKMLVIAEFTPILVAMKYDDHENCLLADFYYINIDNEPTLKYSMINTVPKVTDNLNDLLY